MTDEKSKKEGYLQQFDFSITVVDNRAEFNSDHRDNAFTYKLDKVASEGELSQVP